MVLSWTRRNVFRRGRKEKAQLQGGELEVEVVIPNHFRCPVSLELMTDPVTLSTGITYDRLSIEKWIEGGNRTCPVTNQVLTTFDIIPNHVIRRMIQDWCVQNTSFGIQRIPTPRIPVSSDEVSQTCSKIMSASQHRDHKKCQELVGKIKVWGRESERNKRCIVGNGVCNVLAYAFDCFSSDDSMDKHVVVLEEILEVLTWMIPLGDSQVMSSQASLNSLVWFLEGKDLASRQNAALLLKEVYVQELAKVSGVAEALVKMVREPIGSTATKACLVTIFNLVSSEDNREGIAERFVELGLVSLLLEAIVDGEKGVCEKALGVLDCICDCQQGKEVVKSNALTLPLVIKKILRVSLLASGFAVSILRKICDKREEGVLIEALQVGAFQKLLVMLQVGCDESTKENATELLKLLNGYRNKAECTDSSSLDFKHLKKPF
ncbi:U-box domain-containing protein 21 [Cajanus cajan]|uniref:U-box domain-containing protein n=1 Tax=Cajanus cajan TaxID=3821 RepID=A0A151U9L9_CAJCA|nr:U-box domain-containing protein 21 [Cajanus cajan]KYP76010.1 U-box domain-containing protein 21 [Cajanus cajan]